MLNQPVITVVGSINMDLVVSVSRPPVKGETIIGESFQTVPGGKGANQAVAAARLGANVQMIGKVGQDEFGKRLLKNLTLENISISGVESVSNVSSGVAVITISEQDNSIVVVPGANNQVTPDYVRKQRKLIQTSDIVLTQLEIPLEAIKETAQICDENDVPLLINPAPAQKLNKELMQQAAFITPNEIEREHLIEGDEVEVLSNWPNKLIVTKGSEGVLFDDGIAIQQIPAFHVTPKDTTGAGDTFNGAFAYSFAQYRSIARACQFANGAAALSVQKMGAQTGMPTKKEVEQFLSR